ncbi:hypothetical protein PTI98_003700 [Pleurotus ostreatus]|nr:hypothetical protein PTI98_003700 [Pleurotus ostreatus]
MPPSAQALLPSSAMSIQQLIAQSLPPRRNALNTIKPEAWYSKDMPSQDLQMLLTRSLPSKTTLQQIERKYGKTWMNGMNSLIDPRYDDGRDRFPLYALTLWKQLGRVVDQQESWQKALVWLEAEERSADPLVGAMITSAIGRLDELGWDVPLQYLRGSASTSLLSALFSNEWLSSDHMDMAAEELSLRIVDDGQAHLKIRVAPVAFANSLADAARYKQAYSKRQTPLLCRYEREVTAKELERLYFPIHVHGNHWIAGFIDFSSKTFGYGDSLAGQGSWPPDTFVRAVRRWLDYLDLGAFTNEHDSLLHGDQTDMFSCGVATLNTIAHVVFGDPLWSQKRNVRERISWFNRLSQRVKNMDSTPYDAVDLSTAHPAHPQDTFTSDEIAVAVAIGDHNFLDLAAFTSTGCDDRESISVDQSTYGKTPPSSTFCSEYEASEYDASCYASPAPLLPDETEVPWSDGHGVDLSLQNRGLVGLEWDGGVNDHQLDVDWVNSEREKSSKVKGTAVGRIGQQLDSQLVQVQQVVTSSIEWATRARKRSHGSSTGSEYSGSKSNPSKKIKATGAASSGHPLTSPDSLYERWKTKLLKDDSLVKFDEKNHLSARHSNCGVNLTMRTLYDDSCWKAHLKICKSAHSSVDQKKWCRFQKKLREADPLVLFHHSKPRCVRHSVCGSDVTMKALYDTSRWKSHLQDCDENPKIKAASRTQTLHSMFAFTKKSSLQPSQKRTSASMTAPCPGVTRHDSDHIPTYLHRTAAIGGGARSVTVIAKEKFGSLFSKLKAKLKKIVLDQQFHEHQWQNDHANERVFSAQYCKKVVNVQSKDDPPLPCTPCKSLLTNKAFKNAIQRPMPKDKNFIFTNYRFRPQLLGEIYARSIGLKDIIISSDAKNTPCIRFAEGVLAGKYKDLSVFTGLVEAMVTKVDRTERGVGTQNFHYAPAWDEFCHIINIHSPRAYQAMVRQLAGRGTRSYREKEARLPRFPMKICNESFQRLKNQLTALGYVGPVGLSCDDTKLLPSLRLYWDKDENSYFLVGGVDGPIRVVNADEIKQALRDASVVKAEKLRIWCVTIPLPKVTPIIFACMGIPNDLSASTLYVYLKQVLNGLIENDIPVVSYACDGTEVERSVQRKLVADCEASGTVKRYMIDSDGQGGTPIKITVPVFNGQPIVMIQDSKHALKTFRNNLFAGARLLTLGNHIAAYRFVQEIAFMPGSPLYHRDVEKLDRQDDNAAARLFSAATLEFIVATRPQYVGLIVYLFVFAELVDAYQNRAISHLERIKMALRAYHFINMWKTYLTATKHKHTQHLISREALDIANIIIEGLIGLVLVYRDHINSSTIPLLPWLHSTEACEHTFGEARAVVKDFTLLDFVYMVPKLSVKLREAVMMAKVTGEKKTASGYCHTYFDCDTSNLAALAVFPSDVDIVAASNEASQDADNLFDLLGVRPSQLHKIMKSHAPEPILPSVNSWLNDSDVDSDDEESVCEAQELQRMVDAEEASLIPRSNKDDERVMSLTCTGIVLAVDDFIAVQSMQEPDEEAIEESLAEEYSNICTSLRLANVSTLSVPSKPLGQGSFTMNEISFTDLINYRRLHQTQHALKATRVQLRENSDEDLDYLPKPPQSLRLQLTREFHAILREDQFRGVTTGLGRAKRIQGSADSTPTIGNAANAVLAADAVTRKNAETRSRLYSTGGFTGILLSRIKTGDISTTRRLALGDIGFIFLEQGLMLGEVVVLYAKGGGKNGRHASQSEAFNVAAMSWIGLKVYEHVCGRRFSNITDTTSHFLTRHFATLPSLAFLSRLKDAPLKPANSSSNMEIELTEQDWEVYRQLYASKAKLTKVMVLSRKKNKTAWLLDDSEG